MSLDPLTERAADSLDAIAAASSTAVDSYQQSLDSAVSNANVDSSQLRHNL